MPGFNGPILKPSQKKKKGKAPKKKRYCEYCGKYGDTHHHHIRSRGAGGGDTPENLITLCFVCHTKAHDGNISKDDLEEAKEG